MASKNHTIEQSMAHSIVVDDGLEKRFWNEAVYTTDTSCIGSMTPAEMWFGEKPNLSNLSVFGFKAFIHVPIETYNRKLDSQSDKCIMMGILTEYE